MIKQATKAPIRDEKKEKKRAREKDRNRFAKKAQILAMRMHEKQTKAV